MAFMQIPDKDLDPEMIKVKRELEAAHSELFKGLGQILFGTRLAKEELKKRKNK